MTRIYVVCEGQTEESFTNVVLQPHFNRIGIYLYPINLRGVSTYGKIRHVIEKLCAEHAKAFVTTLIDFYAFPKDFSQENRNVGDPMTRIAALEDAFSQSINRVNFIANLVAHEFEGLLFSSPESFSGYFGPEGVDGILAIRRQFVSPEHIDDGPSTAPSKRILRLFPSYNKVLYGTLIAQAIGLDVIRRECPRFDSWMKRLESFSRGIGA